MADERNPNSEFRPRGPLGGWHAWWWVWLVFILVMIFWFAGWGWWGHGGWWWGNQRAVVVEVTGPGLAVLNAANRQAYVGRPFQANGVVVRARVNNHAYWIGIRNSAPMLVVTTAAPSATSAIARGSRVSVTGTVQKAPPPNQAKQNWGLNQNQTDRVEHQGAYVQASMIQPALAVQGRSVE